MASAAVSRDSVRIESSCGTPVFLFQSILFLAALGLCSCVRAFSTCIMEWLPSLWCPGSSLWWLHLLQSVGSKAHGLRSCDAQV